jgi:hypothetical protein
MSYDFSTNRATINGSTSNLFRVIGGVGEEGVPTVNSNSLVVNSEDTCCWMDLRRAVRSGTIRFDVEIEDLGSVDSPCTYFTYGHKTPGEKASSISVVRNPGESFPRLYSTCTDETSIPLLTPNIMSGKHTLTLDINNHSIGNKIELYVDGEWVSGTDGLSFDELNVTKSWFLIGTTGYSARRINLMPDNQTDIIDSPEHLVFTSFEFTLNLPDDAAYANTKTLQATSGGTNYMVNTSVYLEKDFTISFWFKSAFETSSPTCICFGDKSSFILVEQSTTGGNQIKLRSSEGAVICYSNPVPTDEWFHMVFTADATTGRVEAYVNGVGTGLTLLHPQQRYKGLRIAKRSDGLDANYASITFELNDLSIFDTALDATQVAAYFANGNEAPWYFTEYMTHFFGFDGSGRANVGVENLITVGTMTYLDPPVVEEYANLHGSPSAYISGDNTIPWMDAPFTFNTWVMHPATAPYYTQGTPATLLLLAGDSGVTGATRKLYLYGDIFYWSNNSTAVFSSTISPSPQVSNQWQMCTVTMDASFNLSFYFNGSHVSTHSTNSANSGGSAGDRMHIGYTGGEIEQARYSVFDVAWWNRVLSSQEISDLHSGTLDIVNSNNLELYLPLSGEISDSGPNNHTSAFRVTNGPIAYIPFDGTKPY